MSACKEVLYIILQIKNEKDVKFRIATSPTSILIPYP